MKVVIQIGFQKSMGHQRKGQLIQAWVNDVEISWQDQSGVFLTSHADTKTKGKLWYLWEGDLMTGDGIRIQASSSIAGVGKDEDNTFQKIYVVDEAASVLTIPSGHVGLSKYPLIKGRIREMGSLTERETRESKIEGFLEDGF